jgi:aryl-alcohol dehydrogenase-like predicted oxidoreductase
MTEQGFGCMGFSAFYSSAKKASVEQGKLVINKALENGVTLFNSATFYGPLNIDGFGSNLRFIKNSLEGVDRSKVQLMIKIGMDTKAPIEKTGQQWNMSGTAEALNADVDYALSQLGTEYIDIIVLCRVPHDVSIEEAVRNMKAIVDQGKARHIGLSEASAETIRRASSVAKIYCIEQEWSLWTRDAEKDIIPTCRELDIKVNSIKFLIM